MIFQNIMKPINELRLAFCSDHAGYELKMKIIEYLKPKMPAEMTDFGAFSAEPCDYADFAHPMAAAIERGEFDFGFAFCGSGNGINMTTNKHQGIRSALCWMPEIASLARHHNNANAMSLPARYISFELAAEMVDIFLAADFDGGRHQTRIDKIPT